MVTPEYLEAKNIAFKYVVYRRRTVNEVREKLKSNNYNSELVERIIEEYNSVNGDIYTKLTHLFCQVLL